MALSCPLLSECRKSAAFKKVPSLGSFGLLVGETGITVSVIKTSQLMLYREIIAVCSQIHKKHINKLCGQNVELLNVKLAVHIVTTVRYI
jgi:hypothetical protein